MQRDQLADFLRRRREGIRPAEVGLADSPRRRTAGLRREEVAMLAGMSVDAETRERLELLRVLGIEEFSTGATGTPVR